MRLGLRGPVSSTTESCLVTQAGSSRHIWREVSDELVLGDTSLPGLARRRAGVDAAESFGSGDGGGRGSTKARTPTRKHNHKWQSEKPALENASARLGFSRRSKVMEIWIVTTLPFGAEMGRIGRGAEGWARPRMGSSQTNSMVFSARDDRGSG